MYMYTIAYNSTAGTHVERQKNKTIDTQAHELERQ